MLLPKGRATMVRAANLFVAASVTLLIVGLVLSNSFKKPPLMSVSWPGSHTGYIIGCEVPCYGLAALFAVFACSYAVRWIRLSDATAGWHLWLSLSGTAIFGFGFALFARVAAEGAGRQAGRGTLLGIAVGLLAGPAVFVVGQLILLVAITSTIGAQRH